MRRCARCAKQSGKSERECGVMLTFCNTFFYTKCGVLALYYKSTLIITHK